MTASRTEQIERLERKLGRRMVRLNHRFSLFDEGDRVLVAVSGGKDSLCMLHMLERAQRIAPIRFELAAVHVDQGLEPEIRARLVAALDRFATPYEIVTHPVHAIVREKLSPGETPCSLCSRLRRGILYNYAAKRGYTRLALGHHADDLIETLLLNVFYSGQLKAMAPKLRSVDGRNTVIRPLALVWEAWIRELVELLELDVIPCGMCDSQPDAERPRVKALLAEWGGRNPKLKTNMLAALSNVRASHLMDEQLLELLTLSAKE